MVCRFDVCACPPWCACRLMSKSLHSSGERAKCTLTQYARLQSKHADTMCISRSLKVGNIIRGCYERPSMHKAGRSV